MSHIPVLLNEVLEGLNLSEGAKVVDATLGEGGHALSICHAIGTQGNLVGLDLNLANLGKAKERLSLGVCQKIIHQASFRNIQELVKEADAILFDLGYSSGELEESGRGFSFQKEEPLYMNYSENGLTAAELLNSSTEEKLTQILHEFGEESFSRKIAREIVTFRKKKRILTTTDLNQIILLATPVWYQRGRLHPATKTYQALRIAVNDELGALNDGLEGGWNVLKPKGRMAVISFHSLEDRIVKNYFKSLVKAGLGILINKKPIRPKREEVLVNPRARSAKLRILEKNEF